MTLEEYLKRGGERYEYPVEWDRSGWFGQLTWTDDVLPETEINLSRYSAKEILEPRFNDVIDFRVKMCVIGEMRRSAVVVPMDVPERYEEVRSRFGGSGGFLLYGSFIDPPDVLSWRCPAMPWHGLLMCDLASVRIGGGTVRLTRDGTSFEAVVSLRVEVGSGRFVASSYDDLS